MKQSTSFNRRRLQAFSSQLGSDDSTYSSKRNKSYHCLPGKINQSQPIFARAVAPLAQYSLRVIKSHEPNQCQLKFAGHVCLSAQSSPGWPSSKPNTLGQVIPSAQLSPGLINSQKRQPNRHATQASHQAHTTNPSSPHNWSTKPSSLHNGPTKPLSPLI